MKIIVDANIVFSGILNSNGKIGDLLINSGKHFSFIAPDYLRMEIHRHYAKLSKISGLSVNKIMEAEFLLCRDVKFISEEQIKESNWLIAQRLVADIDENDTPYIAFAKQFRCKLWSGDKHLLKGLVKKGFKNGITTDELFKLRSRLK